MKSAILIDTKIAIEILKRMKTIRLVEETIAQKYNEWKMRCPTHLCTGQEAVAAVFGLVLRKDDFTVGGHRAHGHYLGKGGDLNKMIAEIYGKATGCSSGKGGSMHLIDQSVGFMGSTAIVGGTIPVGVGLGLAIQLQASDQVSCICFGDGATEEGAFYESINFALLKSLPVLFICENNFYSVYSPLSVRQPKGIQIHKMVEGLGVTSAKGDGNNPIEVYHLIKNAVASIRQGNGPVFLEFVTYRWREHCGPNFDNNLGYRTEEEFLEWKKRDPIPFLEEYLISQNAIDSDNIKIIEKDIMLVINRAFSLAENDPFPEEKEAFTGLCAEYRK